MMTERQAAFRADYRTRISPWYSGLGHVLVIAALGLATIWYCARNVNQPTALEWLVVPAAFLASNIFEWAMHRFIMHRPVKGLMGIYKRHTLAHHQFFTDHEPTIDDTNDFRITFFPPYALVTFIAMSIPPALVLGYLWSASSGTLSSATAASRSVIWALWLICRPPAG